MHWVSLLWQIFQRCHHAAWWQGQTDATHWLLQGPIAANKVLAGSFTNKQCIVLQLWLRMVTVHVNCVRQLPGKRHNLVACPALGGSWMLKSSMCASNTHTGHSVDATTFTGAGAVNSTSDKGRSPKLLCHNFVTLH